MTWRKRALTGAVVCAAAALAAGPGKTVMAESADLRQAPGKKYNRLIHEKSPYLVQHAHNPIWWHPWGPEALETARRENKPIFLSIGYSTCYWCHFMEKDSFEKQDVADVLNAHFISIKVDREERPDVDNIYMTALVSMTGAGGWPMSMFLTPDGRPFFGASTIPHESFVALLNQIAGVWKNEEQKIRDSGRQIAETLGRYLNPQLSGRDAGESALREFFLEMESQFDETFAGFGGGNKFPRPHVLSALLRIHRRRTADTAALPMVTRTLKAMSRGGMHDLIAGGFHRYSVDRQWDIPHFEKMLYDNAGLALTFLEAFQATKDAEFSAVAAKTLDWVLAEMTHADGGFYSAQDAGDFGEEGDFYSWTVAELEGLLTGQEMVWVKKMYQVTPHGNFEGGRTVFHVPDDTALPSAADPIFSKIHTKLSEARSRRPRPRLDDKILTDWNGLMIAAMARGYQVLGEERYLAAARRAALFIQSELTDSDGLLRHRWREGEAAKRGLLDDYAFLIHGLLELYQSDFDPAWFDWALRLQARQDELFWDNQAGAYFMDDALDPTLIVRSKDFEDMAMPSGNSISALNLLRFAAFTYDDSHRTRANGVIRASAIYLDRSPGACPQMLIALDFALDRSMEIAVVGRPGYLRSVDPFLAVIRGRFLPNKVVAVMAGKQVSEGPKLLLGKTVAKGRPTVYVCEKGSCKLPVTEVRALDQQLDERTPLRW